MSFIIGMGFLSIGFNTIAPIASMLVPRNSPMLVEIMPESLERAGPESNRWELFSKFTDTNSSDVFSPNDFSSIPIIFIFLSYCCASSLRLEPLAKPAPSFLNSPGLISTMPSPVVIVCPPAPPPVEFSGGAGIV